MNPTFPTPVSVILVDDCAAVRRRLLEQLAETPAVRVLAEAANARDAVFLLGQHAPDAIVTDIQLPDAQGLEFLARLKRLAPAAVVIVLTNAYGIETESACRRAGADHYLRKAIEFERLNIILEKLARVPRAVLSVCGET